MIRKTIVLISELSSGTLGVSLQAPCYPEPKKFKYIEKNVFFSGHKTKDQTSTDLDI